MAVGLLSGCALPPAVSIASYVGDGFLYIVSGKSSTDHGISALTGEDCATWRVLNNDDICKDRTLMAQAEDASRVSGPYLIRDKADSTVAALPKHVSAPVWQERVLGWLEPNKAIR